MKRTKVLAAEDVGEAKFLLDELQGLRIFAMRVERTPSERFFLTVELYEDRQSQKLFTRAVRLPEALDCEALREPIIALVRKREQAVLRKLRSLGVGTKPYRGLYKEKASR